MVPRILVALLTPRPALRNQRNLEKLVDLSNSNKSALLGRAVLFVGAGFSQGATNLRGASLKSGNQITEYFSALANLPTSVGLEELSEEVLNLYGVDFLLEEMKQEFTVSKLAVFQEGIARIPWKRIYTTNYDNVIESAFAAQGKSLHSVTLSDPIRNFPKDRPICVHLNGSIATANRSNLLSEIKLTETSYLTTDVADSKWATLFRQDLAAADAVYYIGYSLWDLDIKRILFEDNQLRAKSFFAIGKSPTQALVKKIERFGTNTGLGAAEVVQQINSTTVTEADRAVPTYHALEPYMPEPSSSEVKDRDVFDLLLYGRVNPGFMWRSVRGEVSYCMKREASKLVVDALLKKPRQMVLHSHLGNGKSLTLNLISALAYDAGLKVFTLSRHSESVFTEIEQALATSGHIVFIVDNYPDWMPALEFIGSHRHDKVSVVLSARNATHAALLPKLLEVLHSAETLEIALDQLSIAESSEAVRYLNQFGMWAERSSWPDKRKSEFVTGVCKSTLQNLLLKLLESPDIGQRLGKIVEAANANAPFGEVLVKIIILTVSGYPLSTNDLADVCGAQVLESAFRRNDAIKELVDFSRGEVSFRSAIAGEYLLKHIANPKVVVACLISILKRLDGPAFAAPQYYAMFKSLIRFSNMQRLLPRATEGRLAMYVYENVKTLKHCEAEPLFWLQYAIACTAQSEFARADTYFSNAYAYAKMRDWFDTYQIDNHFARFRLQRSIQFAVGAEGMQDFRAAKKLILAQIDRERLHYTYSVASLIGGFYDAYQTKINTSEKREIRKAAEQICEIISKLPSNRKDDGDINRCYDILQRVVALAGA